MEGLEGRYPRGLEGGNGGDVTIFFQLKTYFKTKKVTVVKEENTCPRRHAYSSGKTRKSVCAVDSRLILGSCRPYLTEK